MLKVRQGFLLRCMMKDHVVVAVGEAGKQFNGMIRLNETGAFLWETLTAGSTEEALTAKLLERFDGLDEASARTDVAEFLASIRFALEEV